MRFRILVIGALLCGCAPSTPEPVQPVLTVQPMILAPAREQEYAAYLSSGTGTIVGQAFLTTRGGDVKLAAGRTVTLDPATSYAREWYQKYGNVLERFADVPPEPVFARARRTTTADAEGRFRFADLPPGNYIVRTTVTWETGGQFAPLQGGIVSEVVPISSTGPNQLVLSTLTGPPQVTALQLAETGAPIITPAEVGDRPYKKLAEVTGISCRRAAFTDPEPTESDAKGDLSRKAGKMGAQAVTDVVCTRGGLSFTKNCVSYIECKGNALTWQVNG